MKRDNKTIGLQDLVEGFLFSLQAEGRAPRMHEYYGKLLGHFLYYAKSHGWSDRVDYLDAKRIREFLSWISSRSFEYVAGNGSRRFTKSKPSTAWPYYKALRRLFNWSVEEGFLEESPVKDIHFKYKSALHRAHARDAVEREEERRIIKGQPAYIEEEYTARLEYYLSRIPYKLLKMRYPTPS